MTECPAIIFGCTLLHPLSTDSGRSSIASLVASVDINAARYVSTARLQSSCHEIVADLKSMVRELLLTFYSSNNQRKPKKLLFYRDGISSTFFEQVIKIELDGIKEACLSLEEGYSPSITFIVAQKRHHSRFFVCDEENSAVNTGPGTVVDRIITVEPRFDFYLCSHSVIQGTSRPILVYYFYDR